MTSEPCDETAIIEGVPLWVLRQRGAESAEVFCTDAEEPIATIHDQLSFRNILLHLGSSDGLKKAGASINRKQEIAKVRA